MDSFWTVRVLPAGMATLNSCLMIRRSITMKPFSSWGTPSMAKEKVVWNTKWIPDCSVVWLYCMWRPSNSRLSPSEKCWLPPLFIWPLMPPARSSSISPSRGVTSSFWAIRCSRLRETKRLNTSWYRLPLGAAQTTRRTVSPVFRLRARS